MHLVRTIAVAYIEIMLADLPRGCIKLGYLLGVLFHGSTVRVHETSVNYSRGCFGTAVRLSVIEGC